MRNPEDWLRLALDDVLPAERQELQRILRGGGGSPSAKAEAQAAEAELERWRTILARMASDRLLEPSSSALEAVLAAYQPAPARLPKWARDLAEQLANVVFDSLATPQAPFAGARSASAARRVRFETNGLELDLLIEATGDTRRLTGQLLRLGDTPEAHASARWLLLNGGRFEVDGETDEHGEFSATLSSVGPLEIRAVHGRALVSFRLPEPFLDAPDE